MIDVEANACCQTVMTSSTSSSITPRMKTETTSKLECGSKKWLGLLELHTLVARETPHTTQALGEGRCWL